MDKLGVDASKMIERGRARDKEERGRKRERSLSRRRLGDKEENAVEDGDSPPTKMYANGPLRHGQTKAGLFQ
jgi:hypothetical protein